MTESTTAVDLEIRIRTEHAQGRTSLTYVVDSPSKVLDLGPVAIPGKSFSGSPEAYHATLFKRIELLHEGLDVDGTPLLKGEIPSYLEGIGHDLYDELFPTAMRDLYRGFRAKVKTLLIVSDEPWIPWELVKPYDATRSEEIIDDDFLCSRYRMTRWLAGNKGAPGMIYAGNIACIEGGESRESGNLPFAAKERAMVASLAQSQPRVDDVSPPIASYENVKDLLETQDLGLLHVASHGHLVQGLPNESAILLPDGRSFRASDLHGPITARIRSNRPLVFFNACRAARQGWSLTRLGGWVDRWVRRCCCGAFIAPQWVINDNPAFEFADAFYSALEGGETISEAVWMARQKVRALAPDSPAWLAFSVFSHPGARVAFTTNPWQGTPWSSSEMSERGITQSGSRAARAGIEHSPLPSPPEPYFAHRYTLLQTRDLIGRKVELDLLTDWLNNTDEESFQTRIFTAVAIGGMGKSALAWKWFKDIANSEIRSLAGRLWWSFYEHGATFDAFITQALAYTSGRSAMVVREMPQHEREQQLLEIFDQQPFLVVLDGLERIMIAYARMDAARMMDDDLDQKTANFVAEMKGLPASAADSFAGQHRLRKTQNPRAGAFLRRLLHVRASRFLVTSRLYPAELQDPFTGQPTPGSTPYFLKGLRGSDSLELWRSLGIQGAGHQVLPILDLVEHHPLVIRALAGEVSCYRRAPGDFGQWLTDHPDFDLAGLDLVQVRSHVLSFALRGLTKGSHRVAETIAAFHMPAHYDTLRAVLVTAARPPEGEKDLDLALADLEDRGLVGWDRNANHYDMHPLVRGVIWHGLNRRDRENVYEDLRAHFESIPAIYQYQIVDPEMLTPAVELCNSLIHLGRFAEAWNVFYTRIDDTILEHLNSHQAVHLLELFFPSGTNHPPPLEKRIHQFELMYRLATAYRANGRVTHAGAMLRRVIEIAKKEDNFFWIDYVLGDLILADLAAGSLYAAERSSHWSAIIGEKLGRPPGKPQLLGTLLMTRGKAKRAQHIFMQSRDLEHADLTDISLAECALLLGKPEVALALSRRALEAMRATPYYFRLETHIIQTLHLQACSLMRLGDLKQANEQLRQTLSKARSINDIENEVRSLISLAETLHQQGASDEARELLAEVWEPVERGPFVLLHADATNVLAEIESTVDKPKAVEAAETAFRLAWCDGPPFTYYWGLSKSHDLLQSLNVADPKMPSFAEKEDPTMKEIDPFSDFSKDTDGDPD